MKCDVDDGAHTNTVALAHVPFSFDDPVWFLHDWVFHWPQWQWSPRVELTTMNTQYLLNLMPLNFGCGNSIGSWQIYSLCGFQPHESLLFGSTQCECRTHNMHLCVRVVHNTQNMHTHTHIQAIVQWFHHSHKQNVTTDGERARERESERVRAKREGNDRIYAHRVAWCAMDNYGGNDVKEWKTRRLLRFTDFKQLQLNAFASLRRATPNSSKQKENGARHNESIEIACYMRKFVPSSVTKIWWKTQKRGSKRNGTERTQAIDR